MFILSHSMVKVDKASFHLIISLQFRFFGNPINPVIDCLVGGIILIKYKEKMKY